MASYRKRQGKWQAQVRLAGKPAISKTFPTKELARAWAAQQETILLSEGILPDKEKSNIKLNALFERYLHEVTPRKKGHETPFLHSCTYSPQTKTNGLGAQQKILVDCLKTLIIEDNEVELSALKKSCVKVDMKDRSFNDALKGLIKRGLIYQRNNWVHIKPVRNWRIFGPSAVDETLRNVVS